MGRSGQRRRFHRQNREDAGHQIQDQPAQQREQHGLCEGSHAEGFSPGGLSVRVGVGRGDKVSGTRRPGQSRPRPRIDFKGPVVRGEYAGDGAGQSARRGAASRSEPQSQALRPPFAGLRRRMVDDPALEREEIAGPRITPRQRPAASA